MQDDRILNATSALAETADTGVPLSLNDLSRLEAGLRHLALARGPAVASALLAGATGRETGGPLTWSGEDEAALFRLRMTCATVLVEALDFELASALLQHTLAFGAENWADATTAFLSWTVEERTRGIARDVPASSAPSLDELRISAFRALATYLAATGRLPVVEALLAKLDALVSLRGRHSDERLDILIRRCELALDRGEPAAALELLGSEDRTLLTGDQKALDRLGLLKAETMIHVGNYSAGRRQLEKLLYSGVEAARGRLIQLLVGLNRLAEAETLTAEMSASEPHRSWYRERIRHKAAYAVPVSPSSADLINAVPPPAPNPAQLSDEFVDATKFLGVTARPQSTRFRAEIQRICDSVRILGQRRRVVMARALLQAADELVRPAASPLLDGYVHAARAHLLLSEQVSQVLTARDSARQAGDCFAHAGELSEELAMREMAVRLTQLAAPSGQPARDRERQSVLRARFHAMLEPADRDALALSEWSARDEEAGRLVADFDARSRPALFAETIHRWRRGKLVRRMLATGALGAGTPVVGLRTAFLPSSVAIALLVPLPDRLEILLGARGTGWLRISPSAGVTRQHLERLIQQSLLRLSTGRAMSRPGDWAPIERLSRALGVPEIFEALSHFSPRPERIVFVAGGIAGQVPFAALPIEAPANGRGPRLLVDAVAIAVANRPAWVTARPGAKSPKTPFLGIAVSRSTLAPNAPLAEAPDLVNSVSTAIRAPQGVTAPRILQDRMASAQSASAALEEARTAFICCHGRSGGPDDRETGLMLNDAWLTPSQIAKLDLRGLKCAAIASCWGHSGRYADRLGAHSVSSAFLQAGAGSVIASLWEQPITETGRFFESIFRGLQVSDPPTALCRAQSEAFRDGIAPIVWAGFLAALPGVVPTSGWRTLLSLIDR